MLPATTAWARDSNINAGFCPTTQCCADYNLCARVVKLWDLQQLMQAEPEEGSQCCYLQPQEELRLGAGVRVRGLVWQPDGSWLVSNEAGSLIKVHSQPTCSTGAMRCWLLLCCGS